MLSRVLSRFPLKDQIFIGFVPVIALVVVLGVFMFTSYMQLLDDFEILEGETHNALLASEFDALWGDLQRSTLLYTVVGYRGVLTKIREEQGRLDKLLQSKFGTVGAGSEPDQETVARLRRYYGEVVRDFEEIVTSNERIRQLRGEYESRTIPELRTWLEDAGQAARQAGQAGTARVIGAALSALESIHVHSRLYLEAPDTGTARAVIDNANALTQRIKGLTLRLRGDPLSAVPADPPVPARRVEALFSEIVQLKRNQMYLLNVVMAGRSAEIGRASATLRDEHLRRMAEKRGDIHDTFSSLRNRFLLACIGIFVLAFGSAVLVATNIARPVNAIAETLSRLAEGASIRNIPGRDRRDEVGDMAAAAQAFKDLADRLDQQSGQLAESNAELERFAYVASHDLQEPLRKIQAFIDILGKSLDDGDAPRAKDMMQRTVGAISRMRGLIEDLLAFSRTRRNETPFERVELETIVNEVVDDLRLSIEESGARVSIGELPELTADPSQMRQVFQNLISNAIKYRDAGKTPVVDISSRPVPCTCHPDARSHDTHFLVEVSDNGIGFDEHYFERIVEPFQRLHGRAEYPGSGIGLAIVNHIVKRHGGKLTARSAPGEGAIFKVELPGVESEQIREAA